MESLNVYFGQILTGILSLNTDRSFSYQYNKHWMESQDGFQLSVSLPMQEALITGSHVRACFCQPAAGIRCKKQSFRKKMPKKWGACCRKSLICLMKQSPADPAEDGMNFPWALWKKMILKPTIMLLKKMLGSGYGATILRRRLSKDMTLPASGWGVARKDRLIAICLPAHV
ncbi:HipA N-terminal domain-containing protein [uncultured Desulfobacter sp.]|uniref:HipA N-terminal domain-containing protein n=1 Tax=uncultured Desulfobacter sp. TaxID=240139 RepID=UPI0029C64755|nr:HipA N-terminal domain-containing protein [uncultured Desulfobacter sp.]